MGEQTIPVSSDDGAVEEVATEDADVPVSNVDPASPERTSEDEMKVETYEVDSQPLEEGVQTVPESASSEVPESTEHVELDPEKTESQDVEIQEQSHFEQPPVVSQKDLVAKPKLSFAQI